MLHNPEQIEWSPCDGEPCTWDGIKIKATDKHLFRTSLYNLKAWNDTLGLRFSDDRKNPSWSFDEIAEAQDSQYYYSFPELVFYPDQHINFINHAGYISRGKDPFLQKFIDAYSNEEEDTAKMVERLFAFVTDSVEYIYSDYYRNRDITMYPYETLLSCRGDCSAKSVLFASILESLDIDYLLIFYPSHVLVGVDMKMPDEDSSPLYFTYQDKKYYLGETTVQGFRIGKGLVPEGYENEDLILGKGYDYFDDENVILYQNPKEHPTPINTTNKMPLDGRNDTEGIFL